MISLVSAKLSSPRKGARLPYTRFNIRAKFRLPSQLSNDRVGTMTFSRFSNNRIPTRERPESLRVSFRPQSEPTPWKLKSKPARVLMVASLSIRNAVLVRLFSRSVGECQGSLQNLVNGPLDDNVPVGRLRPIAMRGHASSMVGGTRRCLRPSRTGWTAIRVPFSKMRTSSASECTSTNRPGRCRHCHQRSPCLRGMRRSSLRTERNGANGSGSKDARSSAKLRRPPATSWHEPLDWRPFQPMQELGVQVFEVAKGLRQEEILPDVAERPLAGC